MGCCVSSSTCFGSPEIIPVSTDYGKRHKKFDTHLSKFFINEKYLWKIHQEKTALELDYMLKNNRHIMAIPTHSHILKPNQCILETETSMAIQMPLATTDLFDIISYKFDWEYISGQLVGIADAIHYLHKCGAAHRDIKPENIVQYDGRLHLIDFDYCYPLSSLAHCGTEFFKCPKKITSVWDCPIETKSKKMDVYSFGKLIVSILWQASNRKMLGHNSYLFQTFRADHVKDHVHPLTGSHGRWLSVALTCISKNPPPEIPTYLAAISPTSITVDVIA